MSTVANKANFVDIEFISASIKIFLPESGEKCHVSYRGMTQNRYLTTAILPQTRQTMLVKSTKIK